MKKHTAHRITATTCAVLIALLGSGCSDPQANSGDVAAKSEPGKTTIIVDEKDQPVSGDTSCVTTGDRLVISVGDQSRGVVGATLVGDEVETLGVVLDGAPLAYTKGVPGAKATATSDGDTYTLNGELVGAPDMANPLAGPTSHAFTMVVRCPR